MDGLFPLGVTPLGRHNRSPAASGLSSLMVGVAVFPYSVLDLTPVTRQKVMGGPTGILLVLDGAPLPQGLALAERVRSALQAREWDLSVPGIRVTLSAGGTPEVPRTRRNARMLLTKI